ncbi:STYKc [Aspergillus sclerotialis]|uniref:STYKc n=1 Tax=Aspergillus sclerotialis TaxID=2070753 RepID=A0A3A2ZUV4_9EURO|nr:STYKc [Aspergillus sclerotialis]
MVLSVIRTWLCDIIWPPATKESDQSKNHNTQPRIDRNGPTNIPEQSRSTLPSPFFHDPYLGLPVIGNGMTGIVLKINEGRAVKKAKLYKPGQLQNREDVEYINEINKQTLDNEIQVFQRLGSYKGIIPHFQTSQYGIELALAQGNLEPYLETYPERENSLRTSWIWSLINTFAYIHSHKIFVDDIALRNILILDEQLKLSDFGQAILLPLDIDIPSANENDLNVQIEILHLGWVLHSIATWCVHKYYFFSPENPDLCWPEPDSFPNIDDVLCGKIIKKCWRGEYTSMDNLRDEALQLLNGSC